MRKLYNPTRREVEFFYAGHPYSVPAQETREFEDDKVVEHCVRFINGPLKEVEGDEKPEPFPDEGDKLDKIPWKELRSLAAEKRVLNMGMNRDQLESALRAVKNENKQQQPKNKFRNT